MTNTENNTKKDSLFESTDFNKKIIDSLPGIFYLYHVTNEGIFLKRWNKKFVTELGYSDQELWNTSASVFCTKKEFIRIEKAIREILVKGWNDIHSTLITKAGMSIPYYYQGYALYIDGETYFMGVGINMSEQHELKKKLTQSEKQQLKEILEKKKIDDLLQEKKRELLTHVVSETHNLQNIREARKKINKLLTKHSETGVCDDLKEIDKILTQNISKNKQWEIFKLRFKEIHPEFFIKLKEKHPNLTSSELKFCAYLRMHLSSSQMLTTLNISKEGVRKTRYRIRKKMGLDLKDILEDYISKF
jgi:DNA-binding CsgD family transcriptional regulator